MSTHKKHTRLSVETWAEVEEIYALGAATISELSLKYGPAERTIKRHMANAGVKKGSRVKELITSTKRKVLEDAVCEPESFAERFRKHNEETVKIASAIQNRMIREVTRLEEDPLGATIRLKALQSAMQITLQTQKIQRTCYGADKENFENEELPELIIRELTPTEMKRLEAKHAASAEREKLPSTYTALEEESDIVETTH